MGGEPARYGGIGTAAPEAGWEGLRTTLSLVLGLGLCGVPFAGPDVVSPAGRPSPELYLRRLQLAAWLPLLRTRTTGRAAGASWEAAAPWGVGAELLGQVRAALAERERLLPYLMTLAQLAHRTGTPYVRPVWWQHPRDRALRDCEDAFLLGDALLIAPVLEPGVRSRAVRLPPGRWYDTRTGAGTTDRRRCACRRRWRGFRCWHGRDRRFRCGVPVGARSWRCGRRFRGVPVADC